MAYTVNLLFLNQGETPPTEAMDGTFATVREAWEAASARVLELHLRSVEAGFQVLDADGQIVDVPGEPAEG